MMSKFRTDGWWPAKEIRIYEGIMWLNEKRCR